MIPDSRPREFLSNLIHVAVAQKHIMTSSLTWPLGPSPVIHDWLGLKVKVRAGYPLIELERMREGIPRICSTVKERADYKGNRGSDRKGDRRLRYARP